MERLYVIRNRTILCLSLIVGLVIGLFVPVCAQTVEQPAYAKMLVRQGLDNDSVLRSFAVRFAEMDTIIEKAQMSCESSVVVETIDSQAVVDSLYAAKTEKESKAFKRKSGLELTGQVYQRLDNTFGLDEDEDKYSRYSTKFQGEVGWNFFNSSFFQRKAELKQISLENKLQSIQQSKGQMSPYWKRMAATVEERYDSLLSTVLYQQSVNMDILNMAMQYTLERDRTSSDKLLDIVNEKMRVEYELSRLCPSPSVCNSRLAVPATTVVVVDSAWLMAAIDSSNADIQASLAKEELIGVKRKLTNYGQEMRLTPFLRASHYLSQDMSSSTNIDAGVRFTFPLYDDTSPKRKAMDTERSLLALDRQTLALDIRQQCATLLAQLARLNQAITTEGYHREQLQKLIALRREAYSKAMGGYNHVRRLEEYNEWLKSLERMYNLMRLRANTIIDLGKAAGCADFARMVSEKGLYDR